MRKHRTTVLAVAASAAAVVTLQQSFTTPAGAGGTTATATERAGTTASHVSTALLIDTLLNESPSTTSLPATASAHGTTAAFTMLPAPLGLATATPQSAPASVAALRIAPVTPVTTTTVALTPPPTTTPPTTVPTTTPPTTVPPRPAPAPVAAPVSNTATVGGAFAELRQCESGGDYSIDTGNGFYGAYQFTLETWHGLGFAGMPNDAPPAVQDRAAQELQARSGWGQWPACSAKLGL